MSTKQDFIINNIINLSHNPLKKTAAGHHYRNIVKNTIIKPFLQDRSILQTPRQGIAYAVNGDSEKPFEGVQQLYLQQIRKDKNYTSPYFYSMANIEQYGLSLKPHEEGYIVSYVNKQTQKIEYGFFYNGNQCTNVPTERYKDNTLETPYIADIRRVPEPMAYTIKNILLNEKFKWNIHNYFNSIYYGIPFTPPTYTPDEKQTILFNAYHEHSTLFKDIKTIHKDIERYLRQANTRKRTKDRIRVR
jgi:hypothetical protein